MNRLRTKPNRTVGILFVIAIVVVLISGLAPPAGAEDSSENWAPKWETGNGGTDIGASGINADDQIIQFCPVKALREMPVSSWKMLSAL